MKGLLRSFSTAMRVLLATSMMLTVAVCLVIPLQVQAAPRLQPTGNEITIVIDPGHGGENRGADEYGEPLEKDMNLVTALAMRDELSKYDNVTVYLTRVDDRDLSLEERAEFADNVDADFLFSIHYNASQDHKRFGSEILVSQVTPFNAYGFQFGEIELAALEEKGFYNRGIKTRVGNGGNDYYGLLRECSDRGIPSVIIEHCHADVEKDRERCETEGQQKAFGELDATCVAKYFGLSSSQLGVNYSSYSAESLVEAQPNSVAYPTINNEDGIDELTIEQENVDIYTGEVTIKVHGFDKNDAILYYEYSINGGEVYSELYEWPGANALTNENDEDFTVKITLGTGSTNPIVFRAYNQFDQDITSNTLTVNWRKDRLAGDGSVLPEETPGEWIDDGTTSDGMVAADGTGTDGAILDGTSIEGAMGDGKALEVEEGTETDKPKKSENSIFVKNGQLTGAAILFIVAPFLLGITLAGLFLYKHLK